MLVMVILLLILGWVATLIGLPGNWLMVLALAGYAYWSAAVGEGAWSYVIASAVIALLGELIEFGASAAGLAKGGSKRGALLAMVGALLGSLVGAGIGLPVPLVGSIVGIVVCSSLGAMLGAMLGEAWKGQRLGVTLAVGKAAFWGRLIGTGAKLICGGVIVGVGLLMLFARPVG